ncbi:bifunctional diguanylate cyclase/phosphodiesterase [Moritella sp. 36]|uniref:bifunctional diguanylate cyclase/phosphodiesterase n=1 Tax=Moritella sp. 36 TaxID=2746233 RepID=UPI0021061310|nr:EAL domain-containing protein [Moritella sp. 36]
MRALNNKMWKEIKTSLIIQLIFAVSIALSIITIYAIHSYKHQQQRLSAQNLSSSYASIIEGHINQVLSATFPLAALIQNKHVDEADFTRFATEILPFYPGIAALQLAPDGIIQYIAPLTGNEQAIGYNLLSSPSRNKEAFAARDSGKLTLAGPSNLIQGGDGAVGRLPIYLNRPNGEAYFWGFVTVLMHFPDVFEIADLPALVEAGFAYQLSHIHPDTEKIQILSHSPEPLLANPVANSINIANVTWMLKVSPINGWVHFTSIVVMSLFGVIFTILTTFFAILIMRIKHSQASLKNIVAARTKELGDNLQRLNLALTSAGQVWFELNVQSGEILFGGQYEQLSEYTPANIQSTLAQWREKIHPDDLQSASNRYQKALVTGIPFELEYRRKNKDGNWLWIHTFGEFTERNTHQKPIRCTGVHTNISQRKHIELRDNARSAVLEKLLKGEPLNIILEHIVNFIEQEQTGTLCSVLLANAQGTHLNAGFSSSRIPDDYSEAVNGIEIGDSVGSCGTAAFTKKRVIVEDIQTHPYWADFKALAANAQLAACWSEPIIGSNNQLLGTFAIYQRKPSTPTEHDFKLLEFAVQLSVIAIERNLSDKKIRLSSRVFSDTNEGLMITDSTGKIIDINPAFTRTTGYSRHEVLGQTPNILSSDKQSPASFIEMWHNLIEQGHWYGEVWNKKKNGELFAARLSISSLTNDDDETLHYVGLFSDITEIKQQQQKLELMAHYDMLTKLPNRSLLADRFRSSIIHSKQTDTMLGVCFLDLDNFKPVNDSYGHDIGDQLLIAVAQRLKTNIRDEDTASRQGGDEFVLLLGDIESSDHCNEILQRINYFLALPYIIAGHTFNISVSIGVTLYPSDDADLDTLLRHADYSMYQAKLAGKNRFHLFNPEHDQLTIQKHLQLDEIQQAFSNNELVLYYQPKINMNTGEVFGVEALIRWLHPEKGLIPPLEFLPIIEGSKLENRIGDWVINEALKQIVAWQKQRIFIEVSVNIASYHLLSSTFLTQLENALASHPNLNSKYLQLEILESSALGDLNTIRNILNTCQDILGVNIALDDFGTGYSSLTHLKNLPANTIKIDQNFVKNMLDDPDDYAIINGVLALADSFNREVIAEGVETTEHGLMLLKMGCYAAQGYGIARPMPATEFPNWLHNYTPNQQWLDSNSIIHTTNDT